MPGGSYNAQESGLSGRSAHLMSWKPRPVRTSSRIAVSLGPSVGNGKSACVTSCTEAAHGLAQCLLTASPSRSTYEQLSPAKCYRT